VSFEAIFWTAIAGVGLVAALASYLSRQRKVALDPDHWARGLSLRVRLWLAFCDGAFWVIAILLLLMWKLDTVDANRRNLAAALTCGVGLGLMSIENARLWNKPPLPEPKWAERRLSARRYATARRAQLPTMAALWAVDFAIVAHTTLRDPWNGLATFILGGVALACAALAYQIRTTGKPEWLVPPGRRHERA
jgi:hypothetical protein